VSRLAPLEPHALTYDKPRCASLDGFTLHAATRAGALFPAGREALLRYVLRPAVAQERVEQRADGLVRITLKKAYADGTILVLPTLQAQNADGLQAAENLAST
jgi:Putative transposase